MRTRCAVALCAAAAAANDEPPAAATVANVEALMGSSETPTTSITDCDPTASFEAPLELSLPIYVSSPQGGERHVAITMNGIVLAAHQVFGSAGSTDAWDLILNYDEIMSSPGHHHIEVRNVKSATTTPTTRCP